MFRGALELIGDSGEAPSLQYCRVFLVILYAEELRELAFSVSGECERLDSGINCRIAVCHVARYGRQTKGARAYGGLSAD